jgi:hypothetical protein
MAAVRELLRLRLPTIGEFRIVGPVPRIRDNAPTQTQVRVLGMEAGRVYNLTVLDHDTSNERVLNVPPFLFEQTNYQFELGFIYKQTGPIQLRLRGQNLLDGRNPIGGHEAYSLAVNFQSAVGFTEIEVWCGNKRHFCLRVEIFSSKLDYRIDLAALRADLQMEVRALVYSLHGKTFQTLHRRRGQNPKDIEWITLLKEAFDRLTKAFDLITRAPLRCVASRDETVSGDRPIRSGRAVSNYIRTHAGQCFPCNVGHFRALGKTWRVEKLPDQRKTLSLDTAENRFVASAVAQMRARIRRIFAQLAEVTGDTRFKPWLEFLKDAEMTFHRWQTRTFLAELPRSAKMSRPSLALHLTVGYREFYEANLSLSALLEVGGGPLELPEKELSTLYELWCFVALANILRSELKLTPRHPTWLRVEQRRVTLELTKGRLSVLEMERDSGELLRVVYNRFDNTPTGVCRPDNTLEIFKRGTNASFRYIFDAKYRLQDDPEYLATYHAPGPPPDAVYRMHAYRDQIVAELSCEAPNPTPESTVWDLGYRRWVQQTVGAFVLYPYSGADADQNKFVKAIDTVGVGGLPFLPSRRIEVTRMLRKIIETSSDAIEDTAVELSTVAERQRIEWAHEYGLLAIVRSPDQLHYIHENFIYHMPYSKQWALRLRADFVLLLLSETSFPGSAGVGFEARIKSVHFGERSEIFPSPPPSRRESSENERYIWFKLDPVIKRTEPLRYSGQPPRFAFTTRLAYREANDLSDLLLIREPERRFRRECEAERIVVQVYDESSSNTQVFDVGQLRLRFKVSVPGREPLNVRFDPVAMEFRWQPDGRFSWKELMFEPKECIASLKRNQAPTKA